MFGKINTMLVDRTNPEVMLVAGGAVGPLSATGIYRSADGGTSWRAVDSGLTGPDNSTDYVIGSLLQTSGNSFIASGQQGIYRSIDGINWSRVSTATDVQGLAESANHRIYAASGVGALVSTDDGLTFGTVGNIPGYMRAVTAAGSMVYVGSDYGTLYAIDEAHNAQWQLTSVAGFVESMAADPASPNVLFVSVPSDSGATDAVLMSTDSGQHFSNVTPSFKYDQKPVRWGAIAMTFSPTAKHKLYIIDMGFGWSTTDNGATWTMVATHGDQRGIFMAPDANGNDMCYFPGDQGLIALDNCSSATNQATYPQPTAGPDPNAYNVDIPPNLTDGLLPAAIVNHLAVAQGSTPTMAVWIQDTGLARVTHDEGKTWKETAYAGGEGGTIEISPYDGSFCVAYNGYALNISHDGCDTFSPVQPGAAGTFPVEWAANTIAFDGQHARWLYTVAKEGVFLSTDGGATFSLLSWPSNALAVSVDPNDSKHIILQTGDLSTGALTVYSTHDGGATWASLFTGTGNGADTCAMTFSPVAAATAVVACSDSTKTSVYRIGPSSTAGLDSATAVTGIPVPSAPSEIAFSSGPSPLLAIPTFVDGIYLSSDQGMNWTRIDQNIGSPFCNGGIGWRGRTLYAACWGQGIKATTFP